MLASACTAGECMFNGQGNDLVDIIGATLTDRKRLNGPCCAGMKPQLIESCAGGSWSVLCSFTSSTPPPQLNSGWGGEGVVAHAHLQPVIRIESA